MKDRVKAFSKIKSFMLPEQSGGGGGRGGGGGGGVWGGGGGGGVALGSKKDLERNSPRFALKF